MDTQQDSNTAEGTGEGGEFEIDEIVLTSSIISLIILTLLLFLILIINDYFPIPIFTR